MVLRCNIPHMLIQLTNYVFQMLFSGFHRALLLSVAFISRLMRSIIRNVDVKIYVVQNFKRHIIKNHSNMFRITKDPSSGSDDLYFD